MSFAPALFVLSLGAALRLLQKRGLARRGYRSLSSCDSPSVLPSHLRIGGSWPKSSRNCLRGVDTTLLNETPMIVTDTANHVRSSVTTIGITIASNVRGKNIKSIAALSIAGPHVIVWRRWRAWVSKNRAINVQITLPINTVGNGISRYSNLRPSELTVTTRNASTMIANGTSATPSRGVRRTRSPKISRDSADISTRKTFSPSSGRSSLSLIAINKKARLTKTNTKCHQSNRRLALASLFSKSVDKGTTA